MRKIPSILFQFFYKLAYSGLVAFSFILRPALRGVNVAIWYDEKLLVIKNSYRRKYTLPGGYVKGRESPKTFAVRELRGEVDLITYPNQHKYARQYKFAAFYKRETVDLFEMTLQHDEAISIDNQEVV